MQDKVQQVTGAHDAYDLVWSRRGEKWLAFSPATRQGLIVNAQGKAFIEAFRGKAKVLGMPVESLAALPIQRMQHGRFLQQVLESGLFGEPDTGPVRQGLDKTGRPSFVYFHVTRICNLHCSYCYNFDVRHEQPRRPELTLAESRDLLRQLAETGVKHIVFTGGEPLKYSHFFDLTRHANQLGIPCSVITNGTLINKEVARRMCEQLAIINVSVDCIHAELNDRYRGKGSYERIHQGIEALLAVDPKKVQLKAVVTNLNVECIREYYEHFRALGVTRFRFSPISPVCLEQTSDADMSLSWDNHLRMDALLAECAGDMVDESTDRCLWSHLCGAGSEIVSISPEGDLYPCQSFHFPGLDTLNVRDLPFLDAYRRSPLLRFVRNLSVDEVSVCKDCDIKYVCGGGCRALAYTLYRELRAHNEAFCRNYRHETMNLVWAEALRQQREAAAVAG